MEDEPFYENLFLDNFEKYKDLNLRQAMALNQLTSLTIKGTPLFIYMNSDPANLILKDYESLKNQTFKWDEIEIPESTEIRINPV